MKPPIYKVGSVVEYKGHNFIIEIADHGEYYLLGFGESLHLSEAWVKIEELKYVQGPPPDARS